MPGERCQSDACACASDPDLFSCLCLALYITALEDVVSFVMTQLFLEMQRADAAKFRAEKKWKKAKNDLVGRHVRIVGHDTVDMMMCVYHRRF